jgi:hypothetical protein
MRVANIALLVFASLLGGCGDNARMASLSPDFSMRLICGKQYFAEIENPALLFMRKEGFRALNKGRLTREHYQDTRFGADVVGLEQSGQLMLHLHQMPFSKVDVDANGSPSIRLAPTAADKIEYSVYLYSLPPTKRRSDLEAKLEAFTTSLATDLNCQARIPERHDNGADARAMFEHSLETKRGWFDQVDDIIRTGAT